MVIYCCGCEKDVAASLISGREVYPHRRDLADLPFWQCPQCKNFVGCHHKTADRIKPLGVIATPAIKGLRLRIHATIDPLWRDGGINRRTVYQKLTSVLGREYHTGDLRSEAECWRVLDAAKAWEDQP